MLFKLNMICKITLKFQAFIFLNVATRNILNVYEAHISFLLYSGGLQLRPQTNNARRTKSFQDLILK